MPTIKISVNVEQDGTPLPGYPFIRVLQVVEANEFAYNQTAQGAPGTGKFTSVPPGSTIPVVNAFIINPAVQVTLHFNGQADTDVGGVVINSNGILVAIDTNLSAAALTNLLLNNNSGGTGLIKGLAAGT